MKLFWLCGYKDQKWKKKNHLRLLNGNFLYVFDYLVLTALQIILCQFALNLPKEFMRHCLISRLGISSIFIRHTAF